MNKQDVFYYLEANAGAFTKISDAIWEYAETAFEETRSAACLCGALREAGFAVESGLAGIDTAFCGSWGQGSPVIAFLGEFDALSGMSQQAFADRKQAGENGSNGHGCGHNMLGAGSLAAAVAFKEYLAANKLPGTVKYFGCPGEEGGSGKAFMAQAGVFSGLDIAFCWHPSYVNAVLDAGMLANYQVLYKFRGTSSHAAASPHLGRSALDAVELMNVGVNYLREHILPTARVHYAITNSGGFSPNVVQAEAEVLYLMRAPESGQVEEIYRRINKIAQGAALMTETQLEIQFVKSCANIVPNKTLFQVMHNNLLEAGMPAFTPEDTAFAAKMMCTLTPETFDKSALAVLQPADQKLVMEQLSGKALYQTVVPFHKEIPSKVMPASSDVGDVSWNVPTGQVVTACYAIGTPSHSWQLVAQGLSPVAHKGLIYAAKVMAGSAIDALTDSGIILQAKAELAERLGGKQYHCAIPEGVSPKAVGKIGSPD